MKSLTTLTCSWGLIVLSVLWLLPAQAHGPFPTIRVKDLPDGLRHNWNSLKSEMNENSHCAAAFDSNTEGDRMVFKCSIHIKMAHEGARRAMRYCEDARIEHHIKMPCKMIVE
ncbi:MAG: hypothetical protein RJA69_104 [Pseudomonadota bacterium]|jgi:hypothetical protein